MAAIQDRFPFVWNKVNINTAITKTASDGVPNNTITTGALPAGTYAIGYSFETNFNSVKDKPLIHKLTGDYAGNEFSQSIPAAQTGFFKNRYYAFPKTITEGTIITHGIEFFDPDGTHGFTVPFCDVFVRRLS